jgi:hypothetical protein
MDCCWWNFLFFFSNRNGKHHPWFVVCCNWWRLGVRSISKSLLMKRRWKGNNSQEWFLSFGWWWHFAACHTFPRKSLWVIALNSFNSSLKRTQKSSGWREVLVRSQQKQERKKVNGLHWSLLMK